MIIHSFKRKACSERRLIMKENDNVNRSESVKKTENIEMFSEYGDIVSIDDVMSMLHIGRSAVYSLLRNQSIKNVMVARKYIIPKKRDSFS